MPIAREQALTVPCPTCGSRPRQPCTANGQPLTYPCVRRQFAIIDRAKGPAGE